MKLLRIVLTLHLRVPLELNDDATQGRNDGELVGLLKKRHYAALQFYSLKLKDFSLTRRVREAVLRSYRIDHVDDQGTFLLPLVKQGSSGKMRMMGKP